MLQGASASVMVPRILATIRTVFPEEQQTKVMSLYGCIYGFASVVGQIGGGALITLRPFGLGWQSIFLINLPVGLLALVGAWRFVPENRPARSAGIAIFPFGAGSILGPLLSPLIVRRVGNLSLSSALHCSLLDLRRPGARCFQGLNRGRCFMPGCCLRDGAWHCAAVGGADRDRGSWPGAGGA
jgi:MFS family permease